MAKRKTTLKKKVSKRQTRKFSKKGGKKGGRKSMKKPASKQQKIKLGGMFGSKRELTTEEKQEKINKEEGKLLKEDLENINSRNTGRHKLGIPTKPYIYKPMLVTKMTGRDYIHAKFDIQPPIMSGRVMSKASYLVLTMTGNDGTKTSINLHSQLFSDGTYRPRLWDMDLVKIKDFLIKEKEHIRIHSEFSDTYSGNIEKAIHDFILMIRNSNERYIGQMGNPGLRRIRRFYRPGRRIKDNRGREIRNGYENAEKYLEKLKELDGAKSKLKDTEWEDYEEKEKYKAEQGEDYVPLPE